MQAELEDTSVQTEQVATRENGTDYDATKTSESEMQTVALVMLDVSTDTTTVATSEHDT